MIEFDTGGTWPRYARTMALWLARRYGEALRQADAILAVAPGDERALAERSRVLASMGRLTESVESHPAYSESSKRVLRCGGKEAFLERMLELASRVERGETSVVPEYAWRYYVEAYAARGDTEQAIHWLERGYQVDRWEFLWWRQLPHPGMPEVRRDPAFESLMARTVGFPPTCPAADMHGAGP